MPLNFPDSPTSGEEYDRYKWNATDSVWDLNLPEYIAAEIFSADYLVVAGGAAAGSNIYHSGGGGAGGMLTGTNSALLAGLAGIEYTITVGAGGANTTFDYAKGGNGGNSQFSAVTSIGGGGGGVYTDYAGLNGGSGGGAAGVIGASYSGGSGTPGQGNDGGDTSGNNGAGGGGAGAVGGNANGSVPGNGGVGLASTIISTTLATSESVGEVSGGSVYYAGGGGGSSYDNDPLSTGGLGGGGNGSDTNGENGTANTGGGGGAGERLGTVTGQGGSGVVIIKYPDTISITVGAGLTSSTSTSGGYSTTIFTSGTDTVTFS